VLIFALLFCHETGLDPIEIIRRKLRTNAKKYPIRLAKGRAIKYTELRAETRARRSRRNNPKIV
jgi:hypothetical protein